MIFNVVCSILVVFAGGAVEIYTFSNVGYLASFIPVLIGYYLLRKHRPNVRRPFKLPEWMKYVALAMAALYAVIYFYGGPVYASCSCNAAGRKTLPVLLHRPRRARSPTCRCTTGASATTRKNEALAAPAVGAPASAPGGAARERGRECCAIRSRAEGQQRVRAHPARLRGPADPGRGDRPRDRARAARERSVHVFSIARVHGVVLRDAQPRPAAHQERVARAARDRRQGGQAAASARASRPTARSSARASRPSGSSRRPTSEGCDAIVMAADPDRNRIVGDMLWTQEPQRVRRAPSCRCSWSRPHRGGPPVDLAAASQGGGNVRTCARRSTSQVGW